MPKILKPFWDYVDKTGDCWLWRGYVDPDGYGKYGHAYAHIVAWIEQNGRPVRDGYELHHRCECKSCVLHVEEITKREHVRIHFAGDHHNKKKTHCKWGHEYSKENTYVDYRGKRQCRECKRLWNLEHPKKGKASEELP